VTTVLNDATVRLGDGRTLAYGEWGKDDGTPVVYFHGVPGSRFECWGGAAPYAAAGVRLITIDRPGIGRSDAKANRAVSDWPSDVTELADRLGLERFTVIGHSAGGAYALGCAHALAERLDGVAVVGSVPPLAERDGLQQLGTARYWQLARERPWLMGLNYHALAGALRVAPGLGQGIFLRHASNADRIALDSEEARARFQASVLEGVRTGPHGLVDDMRVLMRPWGFRTSEISLPVQLWHGEDDAHIHPGASERYAEQIPGAIVALVPGEGHFSLPERLTGEIVSALTASGRS
jgi:pimeloyl-ACP methyl ester carboxylesterase